MKRVRSFLSITLLGGFMVVLPLAILVLFAEWVFGVITKLAKPVNDWVASWSPLTNYLADFTGVAILLAGCFLIGLLVKTNLGQWLHDLMDDVLGKIVPGYETINKLVSQLLGGEGNTSLLKGEPCRAYIFGPSVGTSVTGIVTAKHANGDFSVYVPTAPFLTSGMVYHLTADAVELLPNTSVEAVMRTIVACGSGSQALFSSKSDAS